MDQKQKKEGKLTVWIRDKWDKLREWYHRDDNVLRVVRFPGTKVPLMDVLIDFFKLFTKGRTMDRAAGVAFNFFVALFPLILFFFTLIPYIPIPHLYERVMLALNDFLIPSGTLNYVQDTIDGIMNQPHEGLLSLSVFLCLIFGSSGIVAIFNGFRNVYANFVIDKGLTLKGWLVQRAFAVLMLVIIGALIVVSVLLISLGGTALRYLVVNEIMEGGSFTFFLFNVLRWVIGVLALCFGIALLYYFGNVTVNEHYRVERKRKGQKGETLYRNFVIFSPGTILATTLFVLGTVAFNTYISNFSRYNVLYGSIGTLIILLLWIWIVAILILAGNDLNSGIRRNADKLSEGEDNIRRREVIIEDLKRHIHAYQTANEVQMEKINAARKTIEEQNVLIQNLEEQVKNNDLIIKAYTEFVEFERNKAAELYDLQEIISGNEENKA
jgi:membrane protein